LNKFTKPERKIVKVHEIKRVTNDSGIQAICGNNYKPIVSSNEKNNLTYKGQK
jgi:hypothetical protein